MLLRLDIALPFHVAVPEDILFQCRLERVEGLVRIRSTDGREITSFRANDYEWLSNIEDKAETTGETTEKPEEGAEQVRYRLIIERSGEKQPFRYLHLEAAEEIPLSGAVDIRTFSIAEVILEVDDVPEEVPDRLRKAAQNLLGHFVDSYRVASNETDVFSARIEESPVIKVFTATEYDVGKFLEAEFRFHSNILQWERTTRWAEEHFKTDLDGSSLERLANLASSGSRIELWMRLLLDAKEYGHRHGEHEIALISVVSAFEVFLCEELEAACSRANITELLVDESGDVRQPVSEALQGGSLTNDLLRNFPEQIVNKNFRSTAAYHRWRSEAYEPRNEVVHAGRRDIEDGQVEDAFSATTEFMNTIRRELYGDDS